MTLKTELLAIDKKTMATAFEGHCEKLNSLHETDIAQAYAEMDARTEEFFGVLSVISPLKEKLENIGYSEEAVAAALIGASLALHTLIEIAGIQEVPRLDI